jgi:hypothetical protein
MATSGKMNPVFAVKRRRVSPDAADRGFISSSFTGLFSNTAEISQSTLRH